MELTGKDSFHFYIYLDFDYFIHRYTAINIIVEISHFLIAILIFFKIFNRFEIEVVKLS